MKRRTRLFLFFILIIVIALYSQLPDNKLHIFICDVGQGDGILIEKGTTQIVIDAGPDNSIESCLGNHMPFWDRTIEVALMTHADSDHSFGFIQMFVRYKIANFLASPVDSTSHSEEFEKIKQEVAQYNIHAVSAVAGKEIKVSGIDLKILFPTQIFFDEHALLLDSSKMLGSFKAQTNDFCAVALLTYQNFSGLLTCDTSPLSESEMLLENIVPHTYFLKIPHHGSKNGLTEEFLKVVNPKIAAISVGVKNRYGHPSPEIIDMLQKYRVKTFRTDKNGEIEIKTNGKKVWVN